jgi:hypothetical protein
MAIIHPYSSIGNVSSANFTVDFVKIFIIV